MKRTRTVTLGMVAATVATLVFASAAGAGASHRNVQILDACDAESFNATLGPGACVRKGGGLTFDHFISLKGDPLSTGGTSSPGVCVG